MPETVPEINVHCQNKQNFPLQHISGTRIGDVMASVPDPWYTSYRLPRTAYASMLSEWHARGWPLGLLLRDHFSAKVLADNGILTLMERFGHGIRWSEEGGLVVRCRRACGATWQPAETENERHSEDEEKSGSSSGSTSSGEDKKLDLRGSLSDAPPAETFVSWNELLPTIAENVRVVRAGDKNPSSASSASTPERAPSVRGSSAEKTREMSDAADAQPKEDRFILNSEAVAYGPQWGFELLPASRVFQFSAADFRFQMGLWVERGWPVPFLLRDHYGAKVLYDNQVFPLMEFYGHEWKWTEERGLEFPVRLHAGEATKMRPWSTIVEIVPIQKTAQGWLLFDGWNYLQDGLVPVHLWQWRELSPSYRYPEDKRPDCCYLDIVSFSWEHEGMQGFGVQTPHGHTAIEFGDDLGNMYSVGVYMDPRSAVDTKTKLAATLRAAFMSPDPYMPSLGEKTVHRIELGTGKAGRACVAQLKQHIEEVQGWRRDSETGIVSTCRNFKYNTFRANCGDFVVDMERYALERLNGKLAVIEPESPLPPGRKMMPKSVHGVWWRDMREAVWNRVLLFVVDVLILCVISTPWLSNKIGVGLDDTADDDIDLLPDNGEEVMLFRSGKDEDSATSDEGLRRRRTAANGDAAEHGEGDEVAAGAAAVKGKEEVGRGRMFRATKLVRSAVHQYTPKGVSFPRRIRGDQLYGSRLKNYSVRLMSR